MSLKPFINLCATALEAHLGLWEQLHRLKNAITQLSGE